MMLSYIYAYISSNKIKSFLMIFSLSIYFLAVSLAVTMSGSINEVAALPMKSIGAETVVQKSGKIPNQMSGAIFPHSNAPIYTDEIKKITAAPFVTGYDSALYFWYFDSSYFKSVLGVHLDKGIYAEILKHSLTGGVYPVDGKSVLVTEDFAQKNSLGLGSVVEMGGESFTVCGILRSQFNGNIAPADIYMDIRQAQAVAGNSVEMKTLYSISDTDFYNMVVLKTDPLWQGDRDEVIKSYGSNYLVFGEHSFKNEIKDQLVLMSSSASLAFTILGVLLAIGFSVMTYYGIKSRENEIALLRMLGWKFNALRNHFVGESMLTVVCSLLLGNVLYALSFLYLSGMKVTMELPWDISAKPHFLPSENNIERIITAPLPLNFDILSYLSINMGMAAACAVLTFLVLFRLKNIKPAEFYRG